MMADLVERNSAHGKTDRHRSIVEESKGVHGVVQYQSQVLFGVQRPCNPDQGLREVRVDAPFAHLVGVGECVAGNPAPRMPMW